MPASEGEGCRLPTFRLPSKLETPFFLLHCFVQCHLPRVSDVTCAACRVWATAEPLGHSSVSHASACFIYLLVLWAEGLGEIFRLRSKLPFNLRTLCSAGKHCPHPVLKVTVKHW